MTPVGVAVAVLAANLLTLAVLTAAGWAGRHRLRRWALRSLRTARAQWDGRLGGSVPGRHLTWQDTPQETLAAVDARQSG